MLRKQIIKPSPTTPVPPSDGIDVVASATVLVTSEDAGNPVDNAFDGLSGPGSTRWVAGKPGEQSVILAFDAPQAIRRVALEVEEQEVARTQELDLAVSCDGGETYRELLRQEYTFSTSSTTFEREDWVVSAEGVTHLRLRIKPDKGGKLGLAQSRRWPCGEEGQERSRLALRKGERQVGLAGGLGPGSADQSGPGPT